MSDTSNIGENNYEETYNDYIDSEQKHTIKSDDFFNKTLDILKLRDHLYLDLLKDFTVLSRERNLSKENKKNDFYGLIVKVLKISGIVFLVFIIRLFFSPTKDIITLAPVVIATFATFLGEFISLPTIIAKYLFNNSEDDNITKIITHTQDFDIKGRQDIYKKGHK